MIAPFLLPVALLATANGGPWGRTGAFGEPTCESSGCHRNEPLGPGRGTVTIDVGPYVPGEKQRVRVTIADAAASAWGYQLSARLARNTQQPAGTFSIAQSGGADDLFSWIHCASGSLPPCGSSEIQYVTHTSVGSRLNTRSGFTTFFIDWTAPSDNVGDIIFAAAGLAADGDQGTNGDRTYTTTVLSLYAPSNQPTLRDGGVVNAASFAQGAPVSPGTLVSLFGDKLGPPNFSRIVARSDLDPVTGKLPLELNRIGVDFFAPGQDPVPAYMLFVSDRQLNVQVPALAVTLPARVEVQPVFNRGQGRNEVRGNRVTVNVQGVSPALFTFPDGKSAAAVDQGGVPIGRVGLFPNSRPARSGDVILVYGTGFGASTPPVEPGVLATGVALLNATVSVRLGTQFLASSNVLYAGAAPSFAGLQQFNIRIPTGLGSGDLPLVISAGPFDSQPGVTLRVEGP
ncbi:MAG: hypothetical protein HY238_09500 [Acidobacteria bacterium]|nr:hypothetical protein [Acidobacteriota bacterium]